MQRMVLIGRPKGARWCDGMGRALVYGMSKQTNGHLAWRKIDGKLHIVEVNRGPVLNVAEDLFRAGAVYVLVADAEGCYMRFRATTTRIAGCPCETCHAA